MSMRDKMHASELHECGFYFDNTSLKVCHVPESRLLSRLRLRNDLYCVEWDVKLYSLTLSRPIYERYVTLLWPGCLGIPANFQRWFWWVSFLLVFEKCCLLCSFQEVFFARVSRYRTRYSPVWCFCCYSSNFKNDQCVSSWHRIDAICDDKNPLLYRSESTFKRHL